MNKYIYFTVCLIAFASPSLTLAFIPNNQTARALGEDAAVFTIDYGFQAGKQAIYLPVLGSIAPDKNEFGFRVRANDEPAQYDNAFGFVVSSAPITNGMYVIKPGTSATFTAIMVVQASSTLDTAKYNTHINYLPFYYGEDQQFVPLNKYQLKTYVTPTVEI